jgi:glycosyltransferase involved in cell wall biosynthesis
LLVSLCVVAYNEEDYLPGLFNDFCNQTYDHSLMEIVLVDSMSTDRTNKIMQEFKSKNTKFKDVKIIKNLKKKQAPGWNQAIKTFTGDAIIRIDAHSSIPPDFVEKNVKYLQSGENITGGQRPNIIDGDSKWKKILLIAENSMFGSGIAPYRRRTQKKINVKSMFHAAYRREVFEKVGGFNENLGRTEDNEIHYRIRMAGYKLSFNQDIISYQHTRSNLRKMMKQKFNNGYWIGLTSGVCIRCLSTYHFVPLAFVIGILFTTLLAVFGAPQLAILMWGIYAITSIVMSILSVRKEKFNVLLLILPLLFFLLHISYGIGTLVGLIKMPRWKKNNKCCEAIDDVKMALQKSVAFESELAK